MPTHVSGENGASNGEKMSPADLNGTADVEPVSKFRQALPQCCAVAAKNLLLLTFGSTLGFSTILIPELEKKKPEINVTMEELTWISSLNLFLVPLGCFASGPISQCLGRRRTMMLSNIPFVLSWLIYHYAKNSAMLFAALALTGLTGGLIEAPMMTYVAEVTQPHLRAKGRLKDSEYALCWLRGWVGPAQVSAEFRSLCESVQKPAEGTDAAKETFRSSLGKKTFYVPFVLVTLAFFIGAFGGTATLQTFAVVIFGRLNAPIEKYTAAVILGVAELIGTIVCVSAIHFTGKRKLTFLSVAGTGLSFLLAAVYGYFNDSERLTGERYAWVPTALMISAAFLSHVGIRLLPWVLAGEVFPVKVRSSATGAAGSIGYIFSSIANKTFLYMITGMSLSGTFFFYALINFAGGVVLFFILPETEGRTLREIEEHYAGIQNLKHRPRKEEIAFKEKWAATNPAVTYDEHKESKL